MADVQIPAQLREPGAAQLRALLELAPDGIFVADTDGRYTYVNEAGCRMLGYGREDLVGMTILDLLPAQDAGRLAQSKAQMLRGASHTAEWTLRRKDGSWLPVEVSASILPDGQWQGFVRSIAERKAHEAKIVALIEEAEAERRWLRTVLDTVPLGVIVFRPGGRLLCNAHAEDLLGMQLSPTGGSAQYAARILYPDGRAVPPEELVSSRVLRRGETVMDAEFLVEQSQGRRIPIVGSAAPIRDAEGRVTGGVGVFQDVSERARMEAALRASEHLLKSIFDLLPVGVWVADASGRIVANNPAGEHVWRGARYVPVSEYGQYRGWWAGSGKPIAAEEWALARALTKGETSSGELVRIQCFDGSFKTIINSAAPLRDAQGRVSGAIVVNEDITALHEARERARETAQQLRTVFDLLPVGLWIADRDGRITMANPAGERIWQGTRYVGPEKFGEYKAWWVETGEPIAPEDWGVARAVRKGETSRGELIGIQCFDGSFKTVINWAAPIRSDAGEIVGAVAVNEDITALHQTQEQLRQAVRDREEILAVVAHDLRNPLSGIIISAFTAERAAGKLPGGEPIRAIAASVAETARGMSGMVEDLLAVAVASLGGASMLKLAPASASGLVARAADAAGPLLAKHALALGVSVAGELPSVNVDADRIARVFANLLDNALKFTSAPGTVTIAAETTAGGVRFSVANSGDALLPAEREAMFQPFWQAGRDRRGAGLGLSICRTIVEAHGGSIWAEPAAGQRVRVCFVLPRQAASGAVASL